MKVLKRKYARIIIVLGFVVLLSIGTAAAFRHNPPVLKGSLIVLAISVLLISFIRWRYLRCPHCGKSAAIVYWAPGWRQSCPRCKKEILFDDQV